MSDTAIRVENLSKLHPIGARSDPLATLRDRVAGAPSAPVTVGELGSNVSNMLNRQLAVQPLPL